MKYNPENVFAKIITGKIPANKVYEDEHLLAFHDIQPAAPVHILVIPKGSYIDYGDFVSKASTEEIAYFFKKIDDIAKNLGLVDSYRLISNKGNRSGQSVFHFHVHIIGGRKIDNLI